MDPEFTLVVNKRKLMSPPTARNTKFKKINPRSQPIPTQNSFEPLSDTSDEEDEMRVDIEPTPSPVPTPKPPPQPKGEPSTQTKTKRPKNPAIVLHGTPSNSSGFNTFLGRHTSNKNYEIKYGRNHTTIFLKEKEAWSKITDKLQENQYDFHTYTRDEDRTHSFVLCGLSEQTDIDELKTELDGIPNLHFKKVFKMNKTRQTKFLVITAQNVTEKSIENVRVVMNTRIRWERYFNNKKFIQCHRCQGWGHATSNCYAKPRCLKCAEPHFTKDCELDEEDEPKCTNCGGPHTANNTECPVYRQLLANYEKKRPTTTAATVSSPPPDIQSTTEFAPLPKPKRKLSNVWKQKKEANEQDNQEDETDYDDMMYQLARLNSLIDMKTFTKRLETLNNKLEKCNNELQKFQVMQKFYSELGNNNGP